MSNIEHLVENGIQATKRNGFDGFNEVMNQEHNQTMLKMEESKISRETLWEIVQYVVYVHDAYPTQHLLDW